MASQTMTAPYSSKTFHSIPELLPIRLEFEGRKGVDFVKNVVGPLIEKHKLEEVFGVGLVHRHFDIQAASQLVEFNNITSAWKLAGNETNNVHGSNSVVYATSWLLDDTDHWMAYEYAYAPNGPTENNNIVDFKEPKYEAFISEYTATIKQAGYEKLLGLRAWPGTDFRGGLEITEGTVNIVLKPGEYIERQENSYSETMWFFTPLFKHGKCTCVCGWTKKGWHLLHEHGQPPAK